jgi:hypothetical protein
LHLEEVLRCTLSLPEELKGRAWVGMFRRETVHGKKANGKEMSYRYLKDLKDGSWSPKAPLAEGNYQLRLQDDTGEVDRLDFSVRLQKEGSCLEIVGPDRLYPGTLLKIHFQVPGTYHPRAWIGIFSTETPRPHKEANGKELSYHYLNKVHRGVDETMVPKKPGSYEARLYERSHFVRAVPFEAAVLRGNASLSVENVVLHPKAKFQVQFTAPEFFPKRAWIGIFKAQTVHGLKANSKELSYKYLEGRTGGNLEFNAPGKAGSYQLRLQDGLGEALFLPIRVTHLSEGAFLEVLSLEPKVRIQYRVPEHFGARAWIGILSAGAPHGNAANTKEVSYAYLGNKKQGVMELPNPGKVGAWQVRLFNPAWDGAEPLEEVLSIPLQPGSRGAAPRDPPRSSGAVRAPGEKLFLKDASSEGSAEGGPEVRDDLDTSKLEAELRQILLDHDVGVRE